MSKFSDPYRKGSLSHKFRARRFAFFESLMANVPKPIRILDVGGTEGFWKSHWGEEKDGVEVILLNFTEVETTLPYVKSLAGDATDLSDYEDDSFDLAHSNSVIEHVVTMENQEKMAAEMMRVGKRLFVQTPNKYFPIEPHYLFPFIQFMPRSMKIWIAEHWKYSRRSYKNREISEHKADSIRLLSKGDMRRLFAGAKFYNERFFGLTKSIVAYKGFETETSS